MVLKVMAVFICGGGIYIFYSIILFIGPLREDALGKQWHFDSEEKLDDDYLLFSPIFFLELSLHPLNTRQILEFTIRKKSVNIGETGKTRTIYNWFYNSSRVYCRNKPISSK